MFIIPLLKYPVIIWSIMGFNLTISVIFLAAAAFIIMLMVDIFEEDQLTLKSNILKATLLVLTGVIVLQPWRQVPMYTDLILLLIIVAVPFIKPFNRWSFTPLILIPLLHIIDLIV